MSQFEVEILSFDTLNELPDSWTDADYLSLLSKMDYENPEDIKPSELKEMCMMSLTDFEPGEAAEIVLEYLTSEQLTKGQIENMSHEIQTEKLWEENPKLSLHPDFFRATQLLHDAFNGSFPRTEAVQFQVNATGDPADISAVFTENPAAPIVRLLSKGMSDRTLVNRLFGDQIEGNQFEEAKYMLWQLKVVEQNANSIVYDIVSSAYWFDDIKYADKYSASTHADEVPVNEED
jgi:hypothetical protein